MELAFNLDLINMAYTNREFYANCEVESITGGGTGIVLASGQYGIDPTTADGDTAGASCSASLDMFAGIRKAQIWWSEFCLVEKLVGSLAQIPGFWPGFGRGCMLREVTENEIVCECTHCTRLVQTK